MAWIGGALVLVAAIVVALVLVLPGSGGSGDDPTGSPPPTTSSGASGITETTLKDNNLCTDGCAITGQVVFTHPQWGKVTLVTAQGTKDGSSPKTGYVAIFDSNLQLKYENTTGPVYTLRPVDDPVDALTHIFLTYNPGRYDGVIVLSADNSDQGMTDYATLPVGDDPSAYRFYDAKVSKASDGRYEIVQQANNCNPDCASGTVTSKTYTWNGSEYAAS